MASDKEFDVFLELVKTSEGVEGEVLELLIQGLRKRYEKPCMDSIGVVLGRGVPLDKARRILFYPDQEEMTLYPALISLAPSGAPDDHPQSKALISALAPLYLVHCKNWRRMKPFIEAGGLASLAAILPHKNLYIASQGMSSPSPPPPVQPIYHVSFTRPTPLPLPSHADADPHHRYR